MIELKVRKGDSVWHKLGLWKSWIKWKYVKRLKAELGWCVLNLIQTVQRESSTFRNREYQGDGITIDFKDANGERCELTDLEKGTEVNWWLGLDDDEADACSDAEETHRYLNSEVKGLKIIPSAR